MTLKGLMILLVDDDPVFRTLVTDFLEQRGASVTEADNGELGLHCLKHQVFDAIIVDLSMPKLGGLDMLKAMKSYSSSVPTIIVSGNQAMSDVVEALRHGANDYLVKPVSDLFLIENAIQQCLNEVQKTSQPQAELESLSYMELNQNLDRLSADDEAAKSLQHQILPPHRTIYKKVSIQYSLFNVSGVSAHFVDSTMIGETHAVVYMAHFHPEDNRAVFASVLLKSFFTHKLKQYHEKHAKVVVEPYNMLSYLNERMTKSGLDIYVDMTYVVIDVVSRNMTIAQSGNEFRCYLRDQNDLTPLALAESMPLGVSHWGEPSVQCRTLTPDSSLCIVSNVAAHRDNLLKGEFIGLRSSEDQQPGGYVELAVA